MFKTVLIANRGEIACRTIRTLRKMGLASVAVYSDADVSSLHTLQADHAVHLGPGPAKQSYLDVEKVLAAAAATASGAIFPGYGFLSENTEFARLCEERGFAWVGPTPEQIASFGLKHRARELAHTAGVPLLPGTDLLSSLDHARSGAAAIGYPVMLKSTAGGGGIGLTICRSEAELAESFESAIRLSQNNFSEGGVFLEKFVENARHIEVQIFGDGRGNVIALGERDCSAQRRNQKVLEETPAPGLTDEQRRALSDAAVRLAKSVGYRSAGTVEFVYDSAGGEFYFLEVNTRLQVEHGVTELVTGLDLVEWMLLTAQGTPPDLLSFKPRFTGHAMQARVYAESPSRGFQPSSGLLTDVQFPEPGAGLRVDTWVARGVEVSPFYDPMLAKIVVHGHDRDDALRKLRAALDGSRLSGIESNLEYLKVITQAQPFTEGRILTRTLRELSAPAHGIEVLSAGTLSAVQDWPGRVGYWSVGIPPSGAMDFRSLNAANEAVGNPEGAAGVEMTLSGMRVQFHQSACIAVAGADMQPSLNGKPLSLYCPYWTEAGDTLEFSTVLGPGVRTYLAVRGGVDVPEYLGSRATFDLGRFGGHGGRNLRPGDVLHIGGTEPTREPTEASLEARPQLANDWCISVMYGPHGAPDFFTREDIAQFFSTHWEVHYNSARTGIRLIGPKPKWARKDGGEAGLHPSNIHDNAYAFGAIDYTGDMPIILGPDGPSLGGFVCPATVISAELWKLGQLKPGDRVRFVPVERESETASLESPLLAEHPASTAAPAVAYRPCGDAFLLVEYGPMVLDLNLRFRVHALMQWLEGQRVPGLIELTPGIRSLQVHFDPHTLTRERLLSLLMQAESELPSSDELRIPSRIVHLPLSWDDESTQLAIRKYTQLVRKDAPWAPSNIEFIRRINGLDSIEDVKDIVFAASYLVLGLGDVYLGAPVATPIDPRHRLVTTKYNPARTWTPENAVGIGGAYMCIYGMEGPGGYQFVGRTLQVYNRYRETQDFSKGTPWLLRFFDQIRFFPVSSSELGKMRNEFIAGRYTLDIEETTFDLGEYTRFLEREHESIAAFKRTQQAAFEAERQRWEDQGLLNFNSEEIASAAPSAVPAGQLPVESKVPGSVWKLEVQPGQQIQAGERLMVLESMKMEMSIVSEV
ncbi:MAG: hypothetical protein RJA70_4472, partial [Pseudomonadota bacterium]